MPPVDHKPVLESMRNYLVGLGMVRKPSAAPVFAEPPLWLEPRDGAIAPGEKDGIENDNAVVLSAFFSGGVGEQPYEASVWRRDTVDIFIRTAKPTVVQDLDTSLRLAFVDKWNWQMDELQIIESRLWRPIQPLDRGEQGYTNVLSFMFQHYLQI